MGQPEEEALPDDCSDSPENWELPQRGTRTEGTKKETEVVTGKSEKMRHNRLERGREPAQEGFCSSSLGVSFGFGLSVI